MTSLIKVRICDFLSCVYGEGKEGGGGEPLSFFFFFFLQKLLLYLKCNALCGSVGQ